MLLSAVSVLVVAQSSSEIPEGLMNNPVYYYHSIHTVKPPHVSAFTGPSLRSNNVFCEQVQLNTCTKVNIGLKNSVL